MKRGMHLHMGGDLLVRMDEVVGIFNSQTILAGEATREMIGFARARGEVEDLAGDDARTIVLCRQRVVLSPVSPQTLRLRVRASRSRTPG